MNALKRVVSRAHTTAGDSRPPRTDLWQGVAARIDCVRQPRRIAFTMSQLAAAGVLLAIASGTFAVKLLAPNSDVSVPAAFVAAPPPPAPAAAPAPRIESVGLADVQYDAAVSDLEQALKQGRGKLDASTIAIVERNLQIIDHAIAQARDALAAGPGNSYLRNHLSEARRQMEIGRAHV